MATRACEPRAEEHREDSAHENRSGDPRRHGHSPRTTTIPPESHDDDDLDYEQCHHRAARNASPAAHPSPDPGTHRYLQQRHRDYEQHGVGDNADLSDCSSGIRGIQKLQESGRRQAEAEYISSSGSEPPRCRRDCPVSVDTAPLFPRLQNDSNALAVRALANDVLVSRASETQQGRLGRGTARDSKPTR